MSSRQSVAEAEETSDAGVDELRAQLKKDPRWLAANHIAVSKGFARSKFLASFILYICEKHLLEQTCEITEQQIGEQVFRRPAGYSPGEDNIVRNYARLLRQRLEEYFAGDGIDEPIVIVVPRGGYVPLFVEKHKIVGDNKPALSESAYADFGPSRPAETAASYPYLHAGVPRGRAALGLKALCAALSIALLFLVARDIPHKSSRQTVSDRFWHVFFSPARDTLLVPADSGLVIYEDLTKRRVHLADYVAGEYQKDTLSPFGIDPALVNELGSRRYTSVVDLNLVSSISQLPAVVKSRFKVRYAREASLDDLKQSNVILLGSFDANPWVELFQKDMNFQFEYGHDARTSIHNLHPLAGEKEWYETDQIDPVRTTFGVIAVTSNLDGTGNVLLIEGINMAGTEAAADYLLSDSATSLLNRVFDSNGNMQHFEVLLKTGNIGANAPRPEIVSQRIGSR